MNSPNNLEINGNLSSNPLTELMAEIFQSALDGSLRLARGEHKVVIYFKAGEAVYAASNQRQHRIFEMLLAAGVVTKRQLVEITDFSNDLVLLKALEEKRLLPESEISLIAARQIEVILKNALEWKDGAWSFSPLARIKEDVCRRIDTASILIEIGRALPKEEAVRRYKSFKETFGKSANPPAQINLRPAEAFLLSRLDQSLTPIEQLRDLSGVSEAETLQTLYGLWLAGFLFRQNWNSVFSPEQVSKMLSAKLELKKQAVALPQAAVKSEPVPAAEIPAAEQKKAELTIEKYLAQVEDAETYYQTLGISQQATSADIKQAYFGLAKRFHPDLHRQIEAAIHARIEHAFTQIAHAYETLRKDETRQTYDFKLRKLLEELEKYGSRNNAPAPSAAKSNPQSLTEVADIFEHGYDLLMKEEYEEAVPFLVRAVHLAPGVARYHAYYGKALSIDKAQRFKAESELQSAVKLEPQTPEFRLMLAEFFIQYNLFKRAEGELNRLLAIAPHNREAAALLDSLPNK